LVVIMQNLHGVILATSQSSISVRHAKNVYWYQHACKKCISLSAPISTRGCRSQARRSQARFHLCYDLKNSSAMRNNWDFNQIQQVIPLLRFQLICIVIFCYFFRNIFSVTDSLVFSSK
jgi:hypothetical protein